MVENAEEPEDIDRVARLDRQLAQTVARLTEIMDAARRDSIERVPVQVGALRAELHAALAALDSRFAAVEAAQAVAAEPDDAMPVRLAALEQEVREAAAAAKRATARIDRSERETPEPVTAADIDSLRTEMRSELAERLAGVQAEAAEETEDLIAMVGEDLTQRLERLARQVADVTGSADSADAALTHLDHEMVRLSGSMKADRRAMAAQVAEIEERIAGMVRQPSPTPAEPVKPGGGRRKIRGADVERLVASVESWRAESVGEEEFFALRAELEKLVARRVSSAQAEMQHRIEMVEAVVADAGADAGDTASLRRDLRTLQEQVAKLQKSPPKPKGKPREPG